MDDQKNLDVCVNLSCHGSEKLILDYIAARRQSDNNILPDLTRLQPVAQTTFLSETIISTSLRYPNCPNSQMFNPEGIENSSSVGKTLDTVIPSTEDCQVGHVKGPTSYYPSGFAFPPMFSDFKESVIEGHFTVQNIQDEGVCNGRLHEKMELEPSIACERRFILFDQNGSSGRIIFHPSQTSFFSPKSTNLEASAIGNYIEWETDSPGHRETVVSTAVAALQKARTDRQNSISIDNIGNEFTLAFAEGEESRCRSSYYRSWQERARSSDSELHEDTEDLEALLSSDSEESSTGHSPSEITRHNGHTHMENDFADVTSSISVKPQVMDTSGYGEDVDYGNASVEEILDIPSIYEKCLTPDTSIVDNSSWELGAPLENSEDVNDDNYSDALLSSHSSYSISDESTSLTKSNGNEHVQAAICVSRRSGSCKRSKREKIKRTVRFLKSIIPGGNGMETAIVLNEAIQYVKLLQMKVKKLEASQLDLKK